MVTRLVNLSKTNSFFLLGARGTGKTSLVKERFLDKYNERCLYIDLLEAETENEYLRKPDMLIDRLLASGDSYVSVIIDEIQKVPKLLDVVHRACETKALKHIQFIMTGSSARKIKRGGANLLAGRAFMYLLYPFLAEEIGAGVSIEELLSFGSLPKITSYRDAADKRRFLKTYTLTYLKEEIWNEQIVRQLEPFNAFLEVAAQHNGQPLNYSKIGEDIGVATKTVQAYYQILEDTLLGVTLRPYHRSIRKQQKQAPKFYIFDCGIIRCLAGTIDGKLAPHTSEFGDLFESFVIHELIRLFQYREITAKFSFLRTNGGAEIDLIIEALGNIFLIEIKSSNKVSKSDLRHISSLSAEFKEPICYCLCRENEPKLIGDVRVVNWRTGIKEILEVTFRKSTEEK